MSDWWNPIDWVKDYSTDSLEGFFYHSILPIILFLMAFGVLVFGRFRMSIRFIIAVVLTLVGLWLMGVLPI